MSRVSPVQTNFNGGALAQRLHGRIDQNIYGISVAEMVGFAPLVEGPMEAMPGTIHVDAAPGPCRLFRFEFSTTQGHVLEFSNGVTRIFTNDSLISSIASPYSFAEVARLRTHQSFDVLYCWLRDRRPRQFFREDAETFGFETLAIENGPFEQRNANEAVRVASSALVGNVTLTASGGGDASAIFAPGDVGGLFRMEAEDFGDITAWEPYMTVTKGQLLTWGERVYRVVGGNTANPVIRTGSLQPVHVKGVEWDGIGTGLDINDDPAAGVQLEYIHDRFGVVEVTGYTDERTVTGTVKRHLPFSSVGGSGTGNYTYTGGYYDEGYGEYVEPVGSVSYSYGTWRWAFGAFSDRRGWPQAGCIWNQRLCLAKDGTIYGSVVGDLTNHAEFNELGEVTDDMAFIITLDDPNTIQHLVGEDRLLAFTSGGVHAIGPSNAAAGAGPGNLKAERQNDAGTGSPQPVQVNSRTLYIDRSRRRIYETDYDAARRVEQELDLTRYARQMGNAGFRAIAPQQHPMNHIWFVRDDGSMACAVYLPEEQALGFADRAMAPGVAARDAVAITDPAGEFDQIWVAAEYGGGWHILRMAPWRLDGQNEDTGCMVEMAADYQGDPLDEFTIAHLPNTEIAVVADGVLERVTTDSEGGFAIAEPASHVVAGLEFPAWVVGLPKEGGGDSGPAMAKKARLGRSFVSVLNARGLAMGLAGEPSSIKPMADLDIDRKLNDPQADETAYLFIEAPGAHTRRAQIRIDRISPFQSTILAWGGELSVEKL